MMACCLPAQSHYLNQCWQLIIEDLWHHLRSISVENPKEHHDDVIKWKHYPRYWPFVRGIHRSPVNSPHKGQWRGALMFSLICPRINGWVNDRKAGDLRRLRTNYDVTVMIVRHTAHTIVSWYNPNQWLMVHTSDLMMVTRSNAHILTIIIKEIGNLKTHSPVYYIKDNWENWLNLGISIYLLCILENY